MAIIVTGLIECLLHGRRVFSRDKPFQQHQPILCLAVCLGPDIHIVELVLNRFVGCRQLFIMLSSEKPHLLIQGIQLLLFPDPFGLQSRQSLTRHLRALGIDINRRSYFGNRHKIGDRLHVIDQKGVVQFPPFGFIPRRRATKEIHLITGLFQAVNHREIKIAPELHISNILFQRSHRSLQRRFLLAQRLQLVCQRQAFCLARRTNVYGFSIACRLIQRQAKAQRLLDLSAFSEQCLQLGIVANRVHLFHVQNTQVTQCRQKSVVFFVVHHKGILFHRHYHISTSSSFALRFSWFARIIFCDDLERLSSSSMKRFTLRIASL